MSMLNRVLSWLGVLTGSICVLVFHSSFRTGSSVVSWFVFTGTYYSAAAYNDPSNYQMVGFEPDCGGTDQLCAIQASVTENGINPVLPKYLGSYIVYMTETDTEVRYYDETDGTTITIEYQML